MEKTLDLFTPGMNGRIKKINAVGAIRRRLLDMGVTPGAEVAMRKVAPLGDPIELVLRGYELTIRKAEAALIVVEVL